MRRTGRSIAAFAASFLVLLGDGSLAAASPVEASQQDAVVAREVVTGEPPARGASTAGPGPELVSFAPPALRDAASTRVPVTRVVPDPAPSEPSSATAPAQPSGSADDTTAAV